MRCPKCGQENLAEAKFCGKCATRLSSADTPVSGSAGPAANGGEVSQGLKVGIILGTVLIPLLGIIMGLVYMNDPKPAKKAVGKIWLFVGIGVAAFECVCVLASGVFSDIQ
jgi:uncharacterized membrane protein YvbJ